MKSVFGVLATTSLAAIYFFGILWFANADTQPIRKNKAAVSGYATYIPSKASSLAKELNKARRSRGLANLSEDSRLIELAQKRALDMADNYYYAHRSKAGLYFNDYLHTVGLPATLPSCENLMLDNTLSAAETVAAWLDSPQHRKCVLNPSYTRVGTANVVLESDAPQTDQKTTVAVAIFADL